MASLIIYGATGYTGRLICEQATRTGLTFTIAGRSEQKLQALASTLEVSYQVFDVNSENLDMHLQAAKVLLNCAGPFAHTAQKLMEACVRCKTHYLDVSAELQGYLIAREMSEVAKSAEIMLLPGCGGSVAMLGCLAAYAARSVTTPIDIDIALHVAGSMSRGSAISAAAIGNDGCLQIKNGRIAQQDTGKNVDFDFNDGRGAVSCFPATLPDLVTLQASTGSYNIQTFVNVSNDAFPTGDIESLPDGPSLEERIASPYHAAVKLRDEKGTVNVATLHTVNGYTFTVVASVDAARRVLSGSVKAGWQTPAGLFGERFIDAVPGTVVVA